MRGGLSSDVRYEGRLYHANILKSLKADGMHYEVNIKEFPRFYLKWSVNDRFDLVRPNPAIPEALVLAVSDILEGVVRR